MRFDAGVAPEAVPVIEQIAELLAPLGIARTPEGRPRPGHRPVRQAGHALGAAGAGRHATISTTTTPPTTRWTRWTRKALDQQVAAYAVMAYVAAETPVDFGRSPIAAEKPVATGKK